MKTTSDILMGLAEFKKTRDFEGFQTMFCSLSNEELKELHHFACELKNACENRMSND